MLQDCDAVEKRWSRSQETHLGGWNGTSGTSVAFSFNCLAFSIKAEAIQDILVVTTSQLAIILAGFRVSISIRLRLRG